MRKHLRHNHLQLIQQHLHAAKSLQSQASECYAILSHASHVLITAPAPQDGDSIGSQLAIRALILNYFPHMHVDILNEDILLKRYQHLPDSHHIKNIQTSAPQNQYEVGIVVDGGEERLGQIRPIFRACKYTIQIDHHAIGAYYPYALRIYDARAAATTELIYRLFQTESLHFDLTQEVAQSLYVGLIFDTGYFRHPSTTAETLEFAAALVRTGFNFSEVGEKAMLSRTLGGMQLMGKMMHEARIYAQGKIIVGVISRELMHAYQAKDEDKDGMIDQLTMVDGVEIAVLFSQIHQTCTRITFRSKKDFDVAQFAKSLNKEQGGGHKKAAGCIVHGALNEIIHQTVQQLLAQIDQN